MSRTPKNPYPNVETVEAIAAGCCEDLDPEHGPAGGYWIVREGTVWQSSARIVALQPAWFTELGRGQTAPKYWPERDEPS